MKKPLQLNLIALSITALFLTGCGDAETNIVQKDSIEVPDEDDHDHDEDEHDEDDHDHDEDEGEDDHDDESIESMGRLAVLSAEDNVTTVFEIDNGDLLDTFTPINSSNTLTASAGYRFAIIVSRENDYVGFIDSGLWREDHGDHLHDYKQAPVMSDFELNGSRPTHVIKHGDETAVFFDGDSETGALASVQVVTDTNISSNISTIPTLSYSVAMHGVAEPDGDYLVSTVRRDDAESTSGSKILPDQVGIYHLHDGEYEQEQLLDVTCPDLHGAAQNDDYTIFGCSDGVLIVHEHDDVYEAEKVTNIDAFDDIRIADLYGHEESDSFIGVASSTIVAINPGVNTMEAFEWQLDEGVSAVSYAFSHEAEYFLVLDSAGYLNILAAHSHDGEAHWELVTSLDISEEDIATMPEGMSFSMTVAQNGDYVYVADPIAKHILQIDLETQSVKNDFEINFLPESLVWLGVAEEAHDH